MRVCASWRYEISPSCSGDGEFWLWCGSLILFLIYYFSLRILCVFIRLIWVFFHFLGWSSSRWDFLRWRFWIGICVQYRLGDVSSLLCEFLCWKWMFYHNDFLLCFSGLCLCSSVLFDLSPHVWIAVVPYGVFWADAFGWGLVPRKRLRVSFPCSDYGVFWIWCGRLFVLLFLLFWGVERLFVCLNWHFNQSLSCSRLFLGFLCKSQVGGSGFHSRIILSVEVVRVLTA